MDSNQSGFSYFDPIAYLADAFMENSAHPPTNPLGLLKFYGNKVKRLAAEEPRVQKPNVLSNNTCSSAATIMKSAKARLLEINSKTADVFTIVANCLGDPSGVLTLVFEDSEIAVLLQAAAEKVATQKFTCARKLLSMCMLSACKAGTPVQRIVYYFSHALHERIDHELGMVSSGVRYETPYDVLQTHFSLQPAVLERQREFKNIGEISQFAGIQSILDAVASAKRIHIIDPRIRNGSHWTVLMQALSQRTICPVEHLKITAIGTSEEFMVETGNRLWSFAETMNLPLSFRIILSELKDIKEDFFELEPNETVAIYASVCLFSLVAWPCQLESLVGVLKNLRPRVMVVHELQASTNSPNFLERFDGALSFLSTTFDCLNACRDDDPYRKLMEEVYFPVMIRNIMVAEGTERIHRHEKINFWRALFVRFGFVETELSSSALCQAKLLQKTSAAYSSCTLEADGKSLILGWMGNPTEFVSAWKLRHG